MTEPMNVSIDVASYGMSAAEFVRWIRDGLGGQFEKVAADIEAQITPAVPEPELFGSIVRARPRPNSLSMLWHPSPMNGKHYWESETGAVEVWSELTDVEVLRIGVGEREDVAPEETSDYVAGVSDTVHKFHGRLQLMYAEAIGAERRNAIERMIQAVEELS